ncbi:hypothetical protein [Acidimangrovimonas pyrenivorans]|uniref:Uncharacterized protein n=1 Tax=Acidimangrovimonas pyrenivorans TaxID=2030798 RepID=A0ABV7AHS9_9RHOB
MPRQEPASGSVVAEALELPAPIVILNDAERGAVRGALLRPCPDGPA